LHYDKGTHTILGVQKKRVRKNFLEELMFELSHRKGKEPSRQGEKIRNVDYFHTEQRV
jgi:hypothetical protein